MAFLILPIVAVLFYFGIAMQGWQISQAVPGAGPAGRADTLAQVSAQQAEMFGAACANTAIAATGVVASSMIVVLPPGATLPTGAVCMTTPGVGEGRNVYGYLPAVAGAAGRLLADTQNNAVWYRAQSAGIAINLSTGQTAAVPTSIPVGALVEWIQTSS